MDAVELDEMIGAIKEKVECAILEIDSVLNPEHHDASSHGSDGTTSSPLERPQSSLSESSGSSATESVPTSEVTPTVPTTTDTVATPSVTPPIEAVSTITHSSPDQTPKAVSEEVWWRSYDLLGLFWFFHPLQSQCCQT